MLSNPNINCDWIWLYLCSPREGNENAISLKAYLVIPLCAQFPGEWKKCLFLRSMLNSPFPSFNYPPNPHQPHYHHHVSACIARTSSFSLLEQQCRSPCAPGLNSLCGQRKPYRRTRKIYTSTSTYPYPKSKSHWSLFF